MAIDDRGDTVGWACFGPCRSEPSALGEVCTLGEVYAPYVSPDLTGQGIGGKLLEVTLTELRLRRVL
ncbi:hypothetical protein [Streptomyces venezuelae]|uniref:hypothetical protein n=1 Tax=Streptomyces venezuelae TaxID=54571 RepID=UPI0037951148